ncbi:SH3 domain-containing protein [Humitalea rosea]|uniref:SH3 domain-containing protein n=2 Tax=Humitalea rosea TaxID=990373 RepID=A0A2W7JS12_9PROT|nr:SH3 domain-containing protein [Humitalea rosea]
MRLMSLLCAVIAIGLAGCDDHATTADAATHGRAAQAQDVLALSQAAAEQRLRAELGAQARLEFRGVQAYRQAAPQKVAVCGQVSTSSGGPAFVPFISILTWTGSGAAPERIDQRVALSNVEATRVYVEQQSHCLDQGGPAAMPRRGAPPPLPRIPNGLPNGVSAGLRRGGPAGQPEGQPVAQTVSMRPAAAASAPPADDRATPSGSERAVTLQQPGNLRAHPNGGGEIVTVLPRGQAVHVFATAPGGWLQVGETEPRGWLHSSLVTASAP